MAELAPDAGGGSAGADTEDGPDAVWPVDDEDDESFGVAVCEAVRRKGHCVIKVADPEEMRRGVVKSASMRDFIMPRPEFEEAYLGRDAESKVAWLDRVPPDPSEDPAAFFLGRAVELTTMLSGLMEDFCGFQPWGLHSGSLLRAPLASSRERGSLSVGQLTEEDVADGEVEQHLSFLQRRRLCLLYPIASAGSTVTLHPREDLPLQPQTLFLQNDELLVFRHDVIGYTYSPKSSQDLVLQTWILDQPQQLKLEQLECDQSSFEAIVGGPKVPRSKDTHVMAAHSKFPSSGYCIDRAWIAFLSAADGFIDIPFSRWDHSLYYSDEVGVTGKSGTRHCAMLDLNDLSSFDNKFFNLTDVEASLIPPGQRVLLEMCVEAIDIGLSLKFSELKGRPIATCIADIGPDWSDFTGMDTSQKEWLKVGAVGHSILSCNRVMYSLGITGPTSQVDTACSSALVAAGVVHGLVRHPDKEVTEGMAMAYMNILVPFPFIGLSGAGMLGRSGRSLTFDTSANGYNRGEGVGGVVLKRSDSARDTEHRAAALVSTFLNQDGRSASLTAPNGPAQQACIRSSFRDSNLQPDDLMFNECHGTGTAIGDPIETGSVKATMGRRKAPLSIGSAKTQMGHLESGAGAVGLVRCITSLLFMADTPNCHLRSLNAHIETTGFPALYLTELVDTGVQEGVGGMNSYGFGGANARADLWGRCKHGPRKQKHWSHEAAKLDFVTVPCARCLGPMCWLCGVAVPNLPGRGKHHCSAIREELASYDYCSNCFGGGYTYGTVAVEDAPDPGRRLYMTGTWDAWSSFEELEIGDGTTYVGKVVLGATLRERFRLVVDKDPRMALYPANSRGSQELRVLGPDSKNQGEDWLIDGRRDDVPAGTVYRVTLDWGSTSKSIRWEPMKEREESSGRQHEYWICGSLTYTKPVRMKAREGEPGTWEFRGKIPTKKAGASFCFLRDNDATQTIYPLESTATDTKVPVMGPGDGTPLAQSFQHWGLRGAFGDDVAIQLRILDGEISVTASVGEQAEVEWRSPPDKRDRYFVVGSFTGWTFIEMVQDPQYPDVYRQRFAVGYRSLDHFQIVLNRNWEARLFPPHANGTPGHGIVLGPSPYGNGLNWMVKGPIGQVMEITLDLASEDRCGMVSCQPCSTALEYA